MVDLVPSRSPERVVVAGLFHPRTPAVEVQQVLDELVSLVRAAGARVVGVQVQRRPRPDAGLFFGKGKVEELAVVLKASNADALVVDQDLSPAQVRNLEQALQVKVLDRTEVILDIFARRASTREARIQVELAQYEYLLPRLTGMWSHLSRTGGGIGTRGPGETQLETDRRVVRSRIAALRQSLKQVERHRHLVRHGRREMFRVSLVGYTNAGKSTLMNSLTKAALPVDDQPFVTLDPTTRRCYLGEGLVVLLTDTVGFVDRLPHHLIAAFHSTLEEVAEADLLLIVSDVSAPDLKRRFRVVKDTLEEIGAGGVDRIHVLNKVDLVGEVALPSDPQEEVVAVSALTGQGLPQLVDAIRERARIKLGASRRGSALT